MIDTCPDDLIRQMSRTPPRGVPRERFVADLERDLAMMQTRSRGYSLADVGRAYGFDPKQVQQRLARLERRIEAARIACRRRGAAV